MFERGRTQKYKKIKLKISKSRPERHRAPGAKRIVEIIMIFLDSFNAIWLTRLNKMSDKASNYRSKIIPFCKSSVRSFVFIFSIVFFDIFAFEILVFDIFCGLHSLITAYQIDLIFHSMYDLIETFFLLC